MIIIDDKIAELERQIELLKSLKTAAGTIDPLRFSSTWTGPLRPVEWIWPEYPPLPSYPGYWYC